MTQPQPPNRLVQLPDSLIKQLEAATKGSGGFQSLAKKLLSQIADGELTLKPDDEERLKRYAISTVVAGITKAQQTPDRGQVE